MVYTNRNLHKRNCPSLVICYIKQEKISDDVPEKYHLQHSGGTFYFSTQALNPMTGQILCVCVCVHIYIYIHIHIYVYKLYIYIYKL